MAPKKTSDSTKLEKASNKSGKNSNRKEKQAAKIYLVHAPAVAVPVVPPPAAPARPRRPHSRPGAEPSHLQRTSMRLKFWASTMPSFESVIITYKAAGYERKRRVNSDRDMRSEARTFGSRTLAAQTFERLPRESRRVHVCVICELWICIFFICHEPKIGPGIFQVRDRSAEGPSLGVCQDVYLFQANVNISFV